MKKTKGVTTMLRCISNITQEALDDIQVGDKVKINNWGNYLIVRAVSKNYFVMSGNGEYSVCEKKRRTQGNYNRMTKGEYHCSTDNAIFGSTLQLEFPEIYKFNSKKANAKYLQQFEDGELSLSERNGVAINMLYVKRDVENNCD